MKTLEDFKKWYYKKELNDVVLDCLAREYLYKEESHDNVYSVVINGKRCSTGDANYKVICAMTEKQRNNESIIDFMVSFIKCVDQAEVLKKVKEIQIQEKLNDLSKDFTTNP